DGSLLLPGTAESARSAPFSLPVGSGEKEGRSASTQLRSSRTRHRSAGSVTYSGASRQWKADDELAPLAGAATAHFDAAAVQHDNFAHDAQTDAESGAFVRPHLRKQIKHVGQRLSLNSPAGVADAQCNGRRHPVDGHRDPAIALG